MHPILARVERLAAYLTAWLVVAVLLATVLTRQDMTWLAALMLLLPICLVYAFVCLSAWYVCRATPLTTSGATRVLSSSAMAAAIASGLWIALARAWLTLLRTVTTIGPTPDQYARHEPLLFAKREHAVPVGLLVETACQSRKLHGTQGLRQCGVVESAAIGMLAGRFAAANSRIWPGSDRMGRKCRTKRGTPVL